DVPGGWCRRDRGTRSWPCSGSTRDLPRGRSRSHTSAVANVATGAGRPGRGRFCAADGVGPTRGADAHRASSAHRQEWNREVREE
ncbi:unnamed protein product, partial [Symbiodinium sp. CCMP2456]